MPYLLKQHTSVPNVNNEHFIHEAGTVLSDWEVSDFVREKIAEGSDWYRERYEPLTPSEAYSYRVKATADITRMEDGEPVEPPWPDYVGLHPHEIVERLKDADAKTVEQAKRYERAGMSRAPILDFVGPAEREPFAGYDNMDVRGIIEKFSVLPDPAVADTIRYERAHKNRPAIVEYDRRIYEGSPEPEAETTTVGEAA